MRNTISFLIICLFVSNPLGAKDLPSQNETAARAVMDAFMTAFNDRNEETWAATLHYPHIRFASEKVMVSNNAKDITDRMDFAKFAASTGWHHSAWDSIELINEGKNKVQFKVRFTRYNAKDQKLASYDSLYIVTKRDGHWGIQARSSFAP